MASKILDVLIVGGGPAGSSLAWALRNTGLKIAILDKHTFPRNKVCAGWVTPAVMQELEIDLHHYADGRVLQAITGFRISQLGQQQVGSRYPGKPVSYGIRRIEFDDYLLQRCGAKILPAQSFKAMERTVKGWLINGEIETRLLVGAGGHFCPVARAIGSKGVSELAVAAQEIEFELSARQKLDCQFDGETPELFFTPDLAGYGWVFRKGNYLNIGLGREDKHRLSAHVQNFCQYLTNAGKISADTMQKFNGHAYLLYNHSSRKVTDDHVLLIGDSAGLAYPQSGEGIRPAVESALLAANTIMYCRDHYTVNNLAHYHRQLEHRFGKRQSAPDLIARLPLPIKQSFASRLMKTHWFTKNIITDKWFLQAHMQPLAQH